MKHYQRIYEDLFQDKTVWRNAKFDSALGDGIESLTDQFRTFLDSAYRQTFYIAICYLWLEKQLIINGHRRTRRFRSGHSYDILYSRFISQGVGRDQATLTRSRWFQITAAVAAEMFPAFYLHNPLEEPEYFQWPFEHVGIDFLAYVYQVDNRMELLKYADTMHMSIYDFKNWVNNYVLCYNDEQGGEIYKIGKTRENVVYIQRTGWDYKAQAESLDSLFKHESKKTTTDNNDDKYFSS